MLFDGNRHDGVPSGDDNASAWPPASPSAAPEVAGLDLLGRLPVPLRRPFKAVLDRVALCHGLSACLLMGSEWYAPFAELPGLEADRMPGMVLSSWSTDLFSGPLADRLSGEAFHHPPAPQHPACVAAGLPDPAGAFSLLAVVPLVFLVDHRRLSGRPQPRCWSDLLNPIYAGDVVCGGWRPNGRVPYQDVNDFLLLCLLLELGAEGLRAFAANLRFLVPNIRTARIAGSNSAEGAAIAVMPWLQADISPRRDRVSVVWPEDGALAMPIGSFVRADRAERVRPLVEALHGPELARLLAANHYPPTAAGSAEGFDALPPGARLRWPGWERMRGAAVARQADLARRIVIDVCGQGVRGHVACGQGRAGCA